MAYSIYYKVPLFEIDGYLTLPKRRRNMQRCYSAEYEDRELREGLPKIIKQYIEEV